MSLKDIVKKSPLLSFIWSKIALGIGLVHWPRLQALIQGGVYYYLDEADHDKIRELLKNHYYVILTRRKSHLSTYLITLGSLLFANRRAYWTHALMNVEGDLKGHLGYKLVEATGTGVHYSTFMQVFDCDSVVFMKPKGVTIAKWTAALDTAKTSLGKQYDTLFDILDDKSVSCVELVYNAMKTLPGGVEKFPNLQRLIEASTGELTPQMLYDCGDLEVVLEIRK